MSAMLQIPNDILGKKSKSGWNVVESCPPHAQVYSSVSPQQPNQASLCSEVSPDLEMLRSLLCVLAASVTLISGLPQQDSGSNGLMGFDTGNPAADHEAGMWTAALIGEIDIS